MAQAGMYLKDGHVYTTWRSVDMLMRNDGLVISRHDLADQIGFINAHGVEHLDVSLGDPRVIIDREYRNALYQRMQQEGLPASPVNHDVDLSPLRACRQLVSLTLTGNLLHSDVLTELPSLRCLNLDNTLGRSMVELSLLHLYTLYLQKPGRNVRGFESISTLEELVIWNYQPRSRDLSALSGLTQLKRLELIQPRIDTLTGVESLPSLSMLEVHYARTLSDITAIDRCLCPVELKLDHVPLLKK